MTSLSWSRCSARGSGSAFGAVRPAYSSRSPLAPGWIAASSATASSSSSSRPGSSASPSYFPSPWAPSPPATPRCASRASRPPRRSAEAPDHSPRGRTVKTYAGPAGQPVPVLAGVDLEIASGEFVAVAGPSGSGKSTLLNLLGLLEPPDGGEVWLGGERVSHLGRRGQARVRGASIGYVFQSFLLLSGLTALDTVLLAYRYVVRDGAEARRDALALLERMAVAHRKDHYPTQLSGGEQQRVAYCRAVLNRPPVVLPNAPP